jgi:UPF0176 protein
MKTTISAYKFVELADQDLPIFKRELIDCATQLSLKGTILLSPEGINLMLEGGQEAITQFKGHLESIPVFSGLTYHETFSNIQPFEKLFVKCKKQIIPFKGQSFPAAPYLAPETLKAWLEEKRDFILLDTRNDYEVEAGSFEGAMDLKLKHFREFTQKTAPLLEHKSKLIVTFCTGGIRCEKAASFLIKQGFENVYQLKGGILSYFKCCGSDFYQGKCYVFDQRAALTPEAL